MKKNFIYALIACFTLSLAACSTDPLENEQKNTFKRRGSPRTIHH